LLRAVAASQSLDGDGEPAAAPYRVLIADDNDAIRLMLSALLSVERDFAVAGEAANGVQAIELAEREGVDLLVLDLSMPELDGLEVLERLRVSRPELRVAVYSGHAAPETEGVVLELGAVDFILKGTPPDELVGRLRLAAAS